MHGIKGTTVFQDHSVSKETIMHLPLLGLHVRALWIIPVCESLACISGVCVCTCGSLTCICGVCARVWILDRPVDPLRIVVDCVCECGSLVCICGRI